MDPRLISILSDDRFRCIMGLITGRDVRERCEGIVDMDLIERAMNNELTEEDIERILDMLPSEVPRDVFRKVVEAAREARERGGDIEEKVAIMLTVLSGQPVSREQIKPVIGIAMLTKCLKEGKGGTLVVDSRCVEEVKKEYEVPQQMVDYFKSAVAMHSLIGGVL
jgi:hypothetical protein